jgi:hypothetical protein
MPRFLDLIPVSSVPVQPFTWPPVPWQLPGGQQDSAARRDASLPTSPAFGWAPASDDPAGWPTYPGGHDRSTILGASPDVDVSDPAYTARLAEDAYKFALWLAGPPSRGPAQRTRELAAGLGPSTNTPAIPIADTAVAPPPQQAGTEARPGAQARSKYWQAQHGIDTGPAPPIADDYWNWLARHGGGPNGGAVPTTGQTPPNPWPADLRAVMPAPKALVWGDEKPGDTRPPPTAADVRALLDANRNAYWNGAVPKPGQTLPPAFSPEEAQSQLNRMTGAALWGLAPEFLKPDSKEDIAEWNRRMTWYMQHPEYTGKMNMPRLKSDYPEDALLLGALDGLMWGVPLEGAAAKVASGLAPIAKAALRTVGGGAERSAVRGALRAGTEQLSPKLLAQADRLLHPGAPAIMGDAPALRGAPIDDLIAGAPREPHTAYATHEFVPGDTTRHRPGLQAASDAEKAAYSRNPLASWAKAPGRRDAIYASFPSRQVQSTLPTQGVWVNAAGDLELNPGFAARPMVSLQRESNGGLEIASQDRSMLRTGETLRATLDGQGGGAAHVVIEDGVPASKAGSVVVPHDGPLTRAEATQLLDVGPRYGLPDLVDRGNGVTMTNFTATPSGVATGQYLQSGSILQDIKNAGLPATPAPAKVDSVYVPLADLWKQGEGSRAVTGNLLTVLRNDPVSAAPLDASELIPQVARNKYALDAERAGSDIVRPDLQNLREIVASGPGWQQRLIDAYNSGKVSLPSLVALGLLPALLPRDDARQ